MMKMIVMKFTNTKLKSLDQFDQVGEQIRSGLVYPVAVLGSSAVGPKEKDIAQNELFRIAELSKGFSPRTIFLKRELLEDYMDERLKGKITKLCEYAKQIHLFD